VGSVSGLQFVGFFNGQTRFGFCPHLVSKKMEQALPMTRNQQPL
jgi:hypothetical protein